MVKQRTKELTLLAFFVAIEIILMWTPLGYIPFGLLRITTLHIPVIVAGIMLGRKKGAMVGFVFGLSSLLVNTFTPTLTSFVFSPWIEIGGIHGNFGSLWIVFGPRILLGYISGLLAKQKDGAWRICLTSVFVTLLHTLMVLGSIYVLFGSAYASVKGMTVSQLAMVFMGIIGSNAIFEMILAGIVVTSIVLASQRVLK